MIEREQLAAEIEADLVDASVLLLAPAGYGKSVLLRQVAAVLAQRYEIVRVGTFGPLVLDRLRASIERDGLGADRPLIVMIDDAQRLADDAAAWISESIEAGPAGIRFLIAGRGSGALCASRLAFGGGVVRYDMQRLAFTGADTEHMRFPSDEARALVDPCEGWPVALAVLASGEVRKAEDFHRQMARYLDETIDNALTPSERQWLQAAALLDAPRAATIAAITGLEPPSFRTMDALPCSLVCAATQEWRLHPLLRRYLFARLQGRGEHRIRHLHRRAAVWFREHDEPYRAASHAIESGDRLFLKSFLDEGARHFIAHGRIADASRWLDYLDSIDDEFNLRIRLYRANALILQKRFVEADEEHSRLTALAEEWKGKGDAPQDMLEELLRQNSYHVALRSYFDESRQSDIAAARALVVQYGDRELSVSGEALLLLGLIELDFGRLAEADVLLVKAAPKLRQSRSWLALVHAITARAHIMAWSETNRSACLLCERLIDELSDAGAHDAPVMALARLRYCEFLLLAGQAEAARLILAAVDLGTLAQLRGHEDGALWFARLSLARLERHTGELSELRRAAETVDWGADAVAMGRALAVADLAAGDLSTVREYFPPQPVTARHSSRPDRAARGVVTAQLCDIQIALASREPDVARDRIGLLLRRVRALGVIPWLVEALVTAACSALQDGGEKDAVRLFREATDLAKAHDCRGVIAAFPLPAVGQLANLLLAQGQGESLVGAPSIPPAKGTAHGERFVRPAPCEPLLTSKEREILAQIALGHSNQRIADSLMISLATTKWHVRNILSKLEAQSRTEALARARAANLIG